MIAGINFMLFLLFPGGLFITLSNIYDGALLRKTSTTKDRYLFQKKLYHRCVKGS